MSFSPFFHSAVGAVCLLVTTRSAGDALPWVLLQPKNDTRDAEMRRWDAGDSRAFVNAANASEQFAGRRFSWRSIALEELTTAAVPFAELRYDAVHPMEFTGGEKTVLREWLTRGGFLLLFEDAYPYTQEKLRSRATLPVYEFLARELPALDPEFRVVRIDDAHPIFHAYYHTETVDSVRREMRENPHYRGRTLLLHREKPAAFFMGRYGSEEQGRWVPKPRPFRQAFSTELKSYRLIVNVYCYAMMSPLEPLAE
jgi:hypothetical protein